MSATNTVQLRSPTGPYTAETNSKLQPYVDGLGQGLSYNSHTLFPELTCKTDEEAQRAATIANIAYQAGYKKAQYDICKALGATTE